MIRSSGNGWIFCRGSADGVEYRRVLDSMTGLARALEGVRILDLSRLLPGPYGTMLLSDLGADVIKIEEPGRGDYFRHEGPRVPGTDEGYGFAMVNRNKRSVTLNLKHEEGRQAFRTLLSGADVLVESFRPGVMERLGFGYSNLKADYPSLIYCSISGFGQDSPYVNLPGHDINYLAIAGVVHLSGTPPRTAAVPITDFESGQRAALAICAALLARQASGRGQHLDISMVDGAVSWMVLPMADYWATGVPPLRMDELQDRSQERLVGLCPGYAIYETSDSKFLAVGASEERFWVSLCKGLDRPDLVGADLDTQALDMELRKIFATRTQRDWVTVFAETDACVVRVNDLQNVISDPHVTSRGLVVQHLVDGMPISALASAFGANQAANRHRGRVPSIGADTDEVLAEAGIESAEIERMRSRGAI
jgi:crotonobetainyl-CoA:carnitine CoA-transferase CaiB-like acyl-CoA transferase